MPKSKSLGLVLVIVGVLANNYVYLHDVILDKHEGMIYVGLTSGAGVVGALIVVFIGTFILWRSDN